MRPEALWLSSFEMESANRVQILDGAVYFAQMLLRKKWIHFRYRNEMSQLYAITNNNVFVILDKMKEYISKFTHLESPWRSG